jgi:hypothetical protein
VEMGLSYFCCYIWDKGAIRDNGANELKWSTLKQRCKTCSEYGEELKLIGFCSIDFYVVKCSFWWFASLC